MNMISGGYAVGPAIRGEPVLVVQEDRTWIEPGAEPRFILAMEHPFPRAHQDSVAVILHMGEVVISLHAAAAQIRKLTQAVLKATEAEDAHGNLYPDASDFLSGLQDASGTFSGTFSLTDEEMAGLGMPPAAKQVMDDARIAARVHPGNTLHVATGSVSVNLA